MESKNETNTIQDEELESVAGGQGLIKGGCYFKDAGVIRTTDGKQLYKCKSDCYKRYTHSNYVCKCHGTKNCVGKFHHADKSCGSS